MASSHTITDDQRTQVKYLDLESKLMLSLNLTLLVYEMEIG